MLGYSIEELLTHYSDYLTDSHVNEKVEANTDKTLNGEVVPPYIVEMANSAGELMFLEISEIA